VHLVHPVAEAAARSGGSSGIGVAGAHKSTTMRSSKVTATAAPVFPKASALRAKVAHTPLKRASHVPSMLKSVGMLLPVSAKRGRRDPAALGFFYPPCAAAANSFGPSGPQRAAGEGSLRAPGRSFGFWRVSGMRGFDHWCPREPCTGVWWRTKRARRLHDTGGKMDVARWGAEARQLLSAVRGHARNIVRRMELVPCHQCAAPIDVRDHVARALPERPSPWRLDRRQVLVRCARCRSCFWIFAFPLFNWVPPARALMIAAMVNLLVVALLLVSFA
jgi:hypothetical protein